MPPATQSSPQHSFAFAAVPQEPRIPLLFTRRQKIALAMHKAGCTHEQIGAKLVPPIRHRQAVGRLLARAKLAEKALARAVEEFICPS